MHSVDVAFLVFYRLEFRLDSSKNSQMLINQTILLLRIEVMPNTPTSLRHSSIQAPFGVSRHAHRSDGAPRSLVQVILSRYHEIIYIYTVTLLLDLRELSFYYLETVFSSKISSHICGIHSFTIHLDS